MYYFIEIENGFIIGQGANPYGIMAGTVETDSARYNAVLAAWERCPDDHHHLRADTLEWE